MIRYTLRCHSGHHFESWFANADSYDRLVALGQVECSTCASTKVEKALMVPNVRPGRRTDAMAAAHAVAQARETAGDDAREAPAAALPHADNATTPNAADLVNALNKLRQIVEEKSEYVGRDFVKEARRIHEGDAPERAIYGEAKLEDARALAEDGIEVLPLPFIPKSQVN